MSLIFERYCMVKRISAFIFVTVVTIIIAIIVSYLGIIFGWEIQKIYFLNIIPIGSILIGFSIGFAYTGSLLIFNLKTELFDYIIVLLLSILSLLYIYYAYYDMTYITNKGEIIYAGTSGEHINRDHSIKTYKANILTNKQDTESENKYISAYDSIDNHEPITYINFLKDKFYNNSNSSFKDQNSKKSIEPEEPIVIPHKSTFIEWIDHIIRIYDRTKNIKDILFFLFSTIIPLKYRKKIKSILHKIKRNFY